MAEEQNDIIDAQALSEMLAISRGKVYRLAKAGILPGIRIGSTWRFSRSRIEQFVKDGTS